MSAPTIASAADQSAPKQTTATPPIAQKNNLTDQALPKKDLDEIEAEIGSSILQKYREGDSIANFTRSLEASFDFSLAIGKDIITHISDKAQGSQTNYSTNAISDMYLLHRTRYHLGKESLRDQIIWIAFIIKNIFDNIRSSPSLLEKQVNSDNSTRNIFRVAILASDILPETCEFDTKVLIDALLSATIVDNKTAQLDDTPIKSAQHQVPLLTPKQVVVMGRRDNLASWAKKHSKYTGINIIWDWEKDDKVIFQRSNLKETCIF
ncbi:hypothetical protein HK100_006235 [Physocladia obscura]|uniref:Uncharacterized protein n=1 Tax=Physocladia obscura TaxID=109957 RepID=A0AAD5TB54_9FUNG|nr:hypothetical protein HK100_006235 [Physocladia obscura]